MFSIESEKKKKPDLLKEFFSSWSNWVLIPTVLGGFIQFIKLITMDASFIRFFAIEQVVPDGLLSLIILLLIIVYLLNFIQRDEFFEKVELGWNKKNIYTYSIYYLAHIIFYIIGLFSIKLLGDNLLINTIQIVMKFLILFYLFKFYYTIGYLYYFRDKENGSFVSNLDYKNFTKRIMLYTSNYGYLSLPLFFVAALSFSTSSDLKKLFDQFFTFKTIGNEAIYIKKVQDQLKIKNNVTIEYFNGKYVFLKVHGKSEKKQYLVLKGEGLVSLLSDK